GRRRAVDARMVRETETIRDQRVREWPGRAVALTGLMQKVIEQKGDVLRALSEVGDLRLCERPVYRRKSNEPAWRILRRWSHRARPSDHSGRSLPLLRSTYAAGNTRDHSALCVSCARIVLVAVATGGREGPRYQIVMQGEQRQLEAVGHPDLAEEVREVGRHGDLPDRKFD